MVVNHTPLPILGIKKVMSYPGSAAVVRYHVVAVYSVTRQQGGRTSVTFAGYVSQEAQRAGEQPLSHITVDLHGSPIGEIADWPTWFVECVLSDGVILGVDQPENPFEDGVAVRGEEPA